MLYIEVDEKADPVTEQMVPFLSHKQPKIIAATLAALTALFHAYGVRIVDPKPPLKAFPKCFGHADKNVRAESSKLAVELYRWLREAIKKLFFEDLKPVQQQDLEKLFEGAKQEPQPKQERLLRSQQAVEAAAEAGPEGEEPDEVEEEPEIDLLGDEDAPPVDILKRLPENFYERTNSKAWAERRDAFTEFLDVAKAAKKLQEGPFDDIVQILAKTMKDTNILVLVLGANVVDVLAKGLKRSFGKYRGRIMGPMLERLKEKKPVVAEALGQALDSVFASTTLSDSLEDIMENLKSKNPQVKTETVRFLNRCLKVIREPPSKQETKLIVNAATKLLTESVEATRNGGAETLGILMKIFGEKGFAQYLEGLDDIRKTKIKEYCDAAQVKAKDKPIPKPDPPPPKAAPPPQKKTTTAGKKPNANLKKPAARRVSSPLEELPPPPQPKAPAGRSIPSKIGGLPKPGTSSGYGLKPPTKLVGPGAARPGLATPKRNITSPTYDDEPLPGPKLGRGLASRPLAKPSSSNVPTSPQPPPPSSGLSTLERTELEELRADKDRMQRTIDDLRSTTSKLQSQIHELQNQNAQLIEDHTRDVLSNKAKETKLVRALSDAEAAEQTIQKQRRELDRLARDLKSSMRTASPQPPPYYSQNHIYQDTTSPSASNPTSSHRPSADRNPRNFVSSPSSEKENGLNTSGSEKQRSTGSATTSTARARGSPSPARGAARESDRRMQSGVGRGVDGIGGVASGERGGDRPEDWKRASEVTNALKARIEQMKVCSLFWFPRVECALMCGLLQAKQAMQRH